MIRLLVGFYKLFLAPRYERAQAWGHLAGLSNEEIDRLLEDIEL